MSIHQFEIFGEKIEFVRNIKTPYTHIYDMLFITEQYFLITTFEEGKIVLMDFINNKIIKIFKHFYKAALKICFVKDKFYLTSHGDYLKRIKYYVN